MLYDPSKEKTIEDRTLDPVRQALWNAADIINRLGWVQGAFSCPGGVCVQQALKMASTDFFTRKSAIGALREYLELNEFTPLMVWNDTEGRTKEQVIGALRSAALA